MSSSPEHLPKAGHARLEVKAFPAPVHHVLILGENERPRPDEAHLTAQDIDELRQLVKRGTAQEPAYARYAGVIPDLEHARVAVPTPAVHASGERPRPFARRRRGHRPELEDRERHALRLPSGSVEGRPAPRVEHDDGGDHDKQRGSRARRSPQAEQTMSIVRFSSFEEFDKTQQGADRQRTAALDRVDVHARA